MTHPNLTAGKWQSSELNLISLTPKAMSAQPKAKLLSREEGLGVEGGRGRER